MNTNDVTKFYFPFQRPEEPRAQSSREPRRQSEDSAEVNTLVRGEARPEEAEVKPRLSTNQRPGAVTVLTNQRTGVEAEILRNIDLEEPEIIDSLRPQPSILSTVIEGKPLIGQISSYSLLIGCQGWIGSSVERSTGASRSQVYI